MADDFLVQTRMSMSNFANVTREAVDALAKDLEASQRADIAAGGMQRFAKSKKNRVAVHKRGETGYAVRMYLWPNFMKAWEYGATSVGKPMLWLPAPGNIFGRSRARQYGGKLIKLKGKNILINAVTRKIAFIGIPRTQIQPVLHLRQIAEDKAAKFISYMKYGAG
jgi:hypothetical protein